MANYISLINETNITGNVNATSIIFNGSVDFTDATPIIGLVDNSTLELITNPLTNLQSNLIQVKDGGITNIKIVSMDSSKLTGYISIHDSRVYFTLPIDLSNNIIYNVNRLYSTYITLNNSDLDTRLINDEANITTLLNRTQYQSANSNVTTFAGSLNAAILNYSTGSSLQYNGNNILQINSDGITLANPAVNKIYVNPGSNLQIGMNSGNTYFYSNVNLSNNQILGCSFGSFDTVRTSYIDNNIGDILIGTLAPVIKFASPININNQAITNISSIASATNIQFNNNLLPNANNTLNIGSSSLGLNKIYCATLSAATSGLTLDGNGGNIIFNNNIIPFSNNSLTFGIGGYALSNIYTIDLNLNGTSLSSRLTTDENNITNLQNKTVYFNSLGQIIHTIIPDTNIFYNLGSNTNKFLQIHTQDLYLAGYSLFTRLSGIDTEISTLQSQTQYQTAGSNITTFIGSLSCPTYTTTGNMTLSVTGANTITLTTAGTSIITNTQINMSNQGIYNCNTLTGSSSSGLLLDGNTQNIILNNDTIPNVNNTTSLGSSLKAMKNVYTTNLKAGNAGLTIDGSGGNIIYNSSVLPNANNTLNLGAAGYAFANVYSIDHNLNGTSLNTTISNLNNKTQNLNTSGQQIANFIPSSTTSYTLGDSSHLWNGIYCKQSMLHTTLNGFPTQSLTLNIFNTLSLTTSNDSNITTSDFTVNTTTGQIQYTGPTRFFSITVAISLSSTTTNRYYIARINNTTSGLTYGNVRTTIGPSANAIIGLPTITNIVKLNQNDYFNIDLRPDSSGTFTFYNLDINAFALLN